MVGRVELVGGRAKVAEFDEARIVEENILDFDVAMDDAEQVDLLQGQTDLVDDSMEQLFVRNRQWNVFQRATTAVFTGGKREGSRNKTGPHKPETRLTTGDSRRWVSPYHRNRIP